MNIRYAMFCMASVTCGHVAVHRFAIELLYHRLAYGLCLAVSVQHLCSIRENSICLRGGVIPQQQACASCLAACHAVLAAVGQQHTLHSKKELYRLIVSIICVGVLQLHFLHASHMCTTCR